jgi:RNA polymerase sigma factor (sigma-70 family)
VDFQSVLQPAAPRAGFPPKYQLHTLNSGWRHFFLAKRARCLNNHLWLRSSAGRRMTNGQNTRTSVTLLGRLSRLPYDQAAWGDFVARYGRQIHHWCRRWELRQADAEDVTQMVLLILARRMRTFAYDPAGSFRAWLKTVTQRAIGDFLEAQENASRGNGQNSVLHVIENMEARQDLEQRLAEEFDLELLEEARARVRLRVEPTTWRAYRLMMERGWSGARVAAELGLKVAAVFVYAGRVRAKLQAEIRRLQDAARE